MTFTPITAKDYQRLKPFFRSQAYRLCAYSLPVVIAWQNDNYRPLAHVDGDTLWIGADFTTTPEYRHLIMPLPADGGQNPETLARVARTSGFEQYWFVPECYVNAWGKDLIRRFFRLNRQKGYDDYVYRTSDLADLKGNRYAKKRNLINQFKAAYVETGRADIEPINDANIDACTVFLERWCDIMACGSDTKNDLACEKIAVLNTLTNIGSFDVRGLAIRIDGDICAFGIGSALTADMGGLHFEKAYADIKGLYQYLDTLCARELFKDVAFINKESDMGIPGLAKAKRSYHPAEMVKSYKLTLK